MVVIFPWPFINKLLLCKNCFFRMKKDLNTLLHHEKVLENANVQLELDWRKRLETRESEIYNQHEELIRNLTTAKDEVSFTATSNV